MASLDNSRGRRRQRFFKTKADAEDWLSSIRSLSPCEQFWKSLPIIERHKIMLSYGEKQSFKASHLESKQPRTIAEAVTCYLDIKQGQGLRPESIKQIRWNLSLLNKAFGQMQCDQISTTILEKWFQSRGWKRSTVDGAIAKIGPFFNWCVREGLAIKNPLKGVTLIGNGPDAMNKVKMIGNDLKLDEEFLIGECLAEFIENCSGV